jgi:hypothetical protein
MIHPRPEVTFTPKEVAVLEYPEENILHEVLAEFGVTVHAKEETIQGPLIAFK